LFKKSNPITVEFSSEIFISESISKIVIESLILIEVTIPVFDSESKSSSKLVLNSLTFICLIPFKDLKLESV
jgi:hypothetical protein